MKAKSSLIQLLVGLAVLGGVAWLVLDHAMDSLHDEDDPLPPGVE